MRELLARGANIEAVAQSGWTSLLVASYRGHLDIVRELLARGANVNVTIGGRTPLMQASYYGQVEVVRALLAAGADKRQVANNGNTAYSVASPAFRAAILALLAAAP